MKEFPMSNYNLMTKQVLVAESIVRRIKARKSFGEIVAEFLPEFIDDDGNCTLEIKSRKFDATISIPFLHRDELFTILHELDKKENPDLDLKQYCVKRSTVHDETFYWSIKIAALNTAIQFIKDSDLGDLVKLKMIAEFKKSIKL
jgi:hypothetical protein